MTCPSPALLAVQHISSHCREDGLLCSPGRNPTSPWTSYETGHFFYTSPEAPGLTYTNSSFRAFAFVAHVQNVKKKKFSLCNQSSSLKQPVNHFSSSVFPEQRLF